MTDFKHETKQKASHTPGPWTVRTVCDGGRTQVVHENEFGVTGIASAFNTHLPTAEANARLIATAPRLLEALEELLHQSGSIYSAEAKSRAQVKARGAIAEAKGLAA